MEHHDTSKLKGPPHFGSFVAFHCPIALRGDDAEPAARAASFPLHVGMSFLACGEYDLALDLKHVAEHLTDLSRNCDFHVHVELQAPGPSLVDVKHVRPEVANKWKTKLEFDVAPQNGEVFLLHAILRDKDENNLSLPITLFVEFDEEIAPVAACRDTCAGHDL